jgi:hypothetical protein
LQALRQLYVNHQVEPVFHGASKRLRPSEFCTRDVNQRPTRAFVSIRVYDPDTPFI